MAASVGMSLVINTTFPFERIVSVYAGPKEIKWVWLLFGNELPPLHRLKEALLVLVNMEGPVLLEML